jgi:hypothetical protein
MMARKDDERSYDGGPVGHKKPPASHQFKKGGKKPAGSGRKKGVKNGHTLIKEFWEEKLTVPLMGVLQTMTRKEYFVRMGWEKAMKSTSVNQLEALLRIFEKIAPDSFDPPLPIQVESIPGDEGL